MTTQTPETIQDDSMRGSDPVTFRSASGKALHYASTNMVNMFVFEYLDGTGFTFDPDQERGEKDALLEEGYVALATPSGKLHRR